MTNMSSTATTFSGYSANSTNQVLPTPNITATGGNSALYQSNKVGGKRRKRIGTKKNRKSMRKSCKNRRTNKNRK
jgi:hypothetical protein